jgi:hypothetical protein
MLIRSRKVLPCGLRGHFIALGGFLVCSVTSGARHSETASPTLLYAIRRKPAHVFGFTFKNCRGVISWPPRDINASSPPS